MGGNKRDVDDIMKNRREIDTTKPRIEKPPKKRVLPDYKDLADEAFGPTKTPKSK